MGWERRKRGGLYYTRSRRVGGRVVREYHGAGFAGQFEEECAEEEREEARKARDAWRAEQSLLRGIDAAVAGVEAESKRLVAEVLTEHGFHKHKGQWRRRRPTIQAEPDTIDGQSRQGRHQGAGGA